jgi:hypothetical protein
MTHPLNEPTALEQKGGATHNNQQKYTKTQFQHTWQG